MRAKVMKGHGASLKAILLGCAADIGGTFLIAPLSQGLFTIAVFTVQRSLTFNEIAFGTPMLVVDIITGSFATIVGGYLTATLAPSRKILHTCGMGLLSIISGVLLSQLWPTQFRGPMWYNVAAYSLTLPSAVAGGFICTLTSTVKSPGRT